MKKVTKFIKTYIQYKLNNELNKYVGENIITLGGFKPLLCKHNISTDYQEKCNMNYGDIMKTVILTIYSKNKVYMYLRAKQIDRVLFVCFS